MWLDTNCGKVTLPETEKLKTSSQVKQHKINFVLIFLSIIKTIQQR